MKYLIISDIHSNLVALIQVLKKYNTVDKVICLGDIVGYGPHPNECSEIILKNEKFSHIVMGNHDAAVLDKINTKEFNTDAEIAINWTKKILKNEYLQKLRELPQKTSFESENISNIIVHGSPKKPLLEYITNNVIAFDNLSYFNENICIVGHSHVPFVYIYKNSGLGHMGKINSEEEMIHKEYRYIINIGAVGQPRDGDPRATALILDTESRTFKFDRIEYDIKKTQDQMRIYKLPEPLIYRLERGR